MSTEIPARTYDFKLNKFGRATVPSELRDEFGTEFRLVAIEDRLELIPKDNPVFNDEWVVDGLPPRCYDYELDDRGQRPMPPELREEYGTEYRLTETEDRLVLYPLNNDTN